MTGHKFPVHCQYKYISVKCSINLLQLPGGPLREFLHLLMGSIGRNNNLFCGEATSRSLRHNIPELMNKTFFHVGEMIAVSLVHGGPSPEFLCEAVANYIVSGVMDMKATICSVPNVDIQEKLKKVLIERAPPGQHYHPTKKLYLSTDAPPYIRCTSISLYSMHNTRARSAMPCISLVYYLDVCKFSDTVM